MIGLVVATGTSTKLILNAGATPTKKSRIDKQLNPQILLNFMILFIMCLVCGILGAIYQIAFNYSDSTSDRRVFPIPINGQDINLDFVPFSEPAFIAIVTFAACLIIFQNIIPIAIYISLDFAKAVQVRER